MTVAPRKTCPWLAITMAALLLFNVLQTVTSPARAQELKDTYEEISLKESMLRVHFSQKISGSPRATVLRWIRKSAEAVTLYYGRFPLETLDIAVTLNGGHGVQGGRAFGGNRPYITITAGTSSSDSDFDRDWRLVHEMIHMAFPRIDRRHHWMTEGLAVYVETVARLQAGHIGPGEAWGGFVQGMEKGLPGRGDKGLDHTHTWGRTYWGGTILLLLADIEIRKRTKGSKTLADGLIAVLAAGGNHRSYWPLTKAIRIADEATGVTVLKELYEAWKATPVDPDLPSLWRKLGVAVKGRSVSFDETAPLAPIRKRIGKRSARDSARL